jgi:hypothetical protein
MPDISDVFKLFSLLSPQEQKKLYSMISYQISTDNDFEQFAKDERFTSGFVCPQIYILSRRILYEIFYKDK